MQVSLDKRPHVWRKLSKELIDIMIASLTLGSTKKATARANGISPTIFQDWINQGDLDLSNDLDTLPAYLVVSLGKLQEKEIISCRQAILASDKSHKGCEWTLEHAYWKDFSSAAANIDMNQRLEKIENESKRDE